MMQSGSHAYRVMPFGLTNAPTTFKRVILNIFWKTIGKMIKVFLDEWTLYTLLKNHLSNLRLMLEICRKSNMSLNPNKCTFMVPFGWLLGHVVTNEGLLTDLMKVVVILNFLVPKTVKNLEGFLGMTGYYHKFIKEYAQIANALQSLLKKKMTW